MLAEIEIFINDNYSVEKIDLITRLFDLLDTLTEEDYQGRYLELLMDDSPAAGDVADNFTALLNDNLEYLFKLYEIQPNEEATLEDLITILESIKAIEEYTDSSLIIRTIEAADDSVDAFANLIASVASTLDATKVYRVIDSVSPSFINKLKEINIDKDEEDTDYTVADNELILNLKQFKKYLGNTTAIGFKLLDQGLPLGASFSHYLKYFTLDTTSKDKLNLAKEIVTLLYMGGDSYKNPIEFFKKHSGLIFDDINLLTSVDVEITKIINHYLSELGETNAQA